MSFAETKPVSPDDLWEMSDAQHFELVNGELVEQEMSAKSSWVAANLIRLIGNAADPQRDGLVMGSDCSYQCFPFAPENIRRPDASFIKAGRLSQEEFDHGHVRIAPNIAAEVVSPTDLAYYLDQKLEDYLRAGVELVWIINPETLTVRVVRPDGSDARLKIDNELTGEQVFSGFRCRVRDLFPPAAS